MLKAGDKAPEFALPDEEGKTVSLSDYKGKKVVLYFYPKDDTPGCTKEACGFRDVWQQVKTAGAVVLGVSADSGDSHKQFKEKYGLPFTLLSDAERNVVKAYGAWGEKSMYGKLMMGLLRSTFIIDEKGDIIKVFPKVKPENHAEEVLASL